MPFSLYHLATAISSHNIHERDQSTLRTQASITQRGLIWSLADKRGKVFRCDKKEKKYRHLKFAI